jgi:membrane-bound metal-dependent hydrolase YbcI (DUF457 family)
MPFTPYHFGPSGLIGLPLNKYIDIPVFILANVIVDIEPLLVMVFYLDFPVHGICHTFFAGIVLGTLWALIAFPLRRFWSWGMHLFKLEYTTSLTKMIISGVLGIWFHVVIDGIIYKEMNPFWPIKGNPIYHIISYNSLFRICEVSCIAVIIIYPALAISKYRKEKRSRRKEV